MIVTIVAVNRGLAVAVTDTDEVLEIVQWLDPDGDDCDEPDAVMAVVKGDGYWAAIDLSAFGQETIN